MSAALSGHCLCGGVTVSVAGGHDPRAGVCHCRMCQRWTGGLFLAFHAEVAGVTVEGPVTRYESSDFAERAFCSVCGSHLYLRNTNPDETVIELMPGLFDAAIGWPTRSEIYVDRAMAAVRLAGDHGRATRAEFERGSPHVAGDVP